MRRVTPQRTPPPFPAGSKDSAEVNVQALGGGGRVAGEQHPGLGQERSYRGMGAGEKTILSLELLNPDFDKDGNVTQFEKASYARLQAGDVDHNGNLSVKEMYTIFEKMAGEPDALPPGHCPELAAQPR